MSSPSSLPIFLFPPKTSPPPLHRPAARTISPQCLLALDSWPPPDVAIEQPGPGRDEVAADDGATNEEVPINEGATDEGGTGKAAMDLEAIMALAADRDQALALAALTRPGPFGPRTLELGDYFGYFERGHLIGMAGERMSRPGFREVSGVCTHPGQQGKGLARRLMLKLVRRQLLRGETPFLHVMCSNPLAHGLYQRMGFSDVGVAAVRVLARLP